MFIVLLRFSQSRHQAAQFMEGHRAWIRRGVDDDVFLLVGGLKPNLGGGILAHNASLEQLQARVEEDPFVAEGVVDAEILELAPSITDPRLAFLADNEALTPTGEQ